ncbi:RagB/SusD family nutrient uptake outer membrane protein [Sphingobacterium sp. SG20118]|uniref:RagB/SusD family nutrient uptake outer membrane protein n=1 Tax=Sphingobacterium TaxID=28453 RepID=UPI002469AE0C|nr:RagB/SusD family nutrient uptake outer membrane protein [Sphingobacterium faecium]MDH5827363.1 RagB/SusD family nutrient uptake outer membrane protein [Sphingobacterium faecium]
MKIYTIIAQIGIAAFLMTGCSKEFLNKVPQGELSDSQIGSAESIEMQLLGAYSIMNGNVSGTWGNYASAPSQWIFGEMTSDNAHKGSDQTDQPNMNMIESYSVNSENDNLSTMWQVYYEGVQRANKTLVLLAADQAGVKEVTAERVIQIQAESRMLRAHYYFFMWRIFKNLPWIDENTTFEDAKVKPNTEDILPKIIEDLKFAASNLPNTKINNEYGRMDQNAAKAYLGKVYLYEKKYAEALPLFKEVIGGKDITSMNFWNNFNILTENGSEAIMVAKHAINSNGNGENANVGDMLGGLYGTSPVGCCGFYQPTIDLANAFKVTANGLPMLDNSYRTNAYKSDMGLVDTKTDSAKTKYKVDTTLRFDPRLDYTVGRRGVMYLDYGVMPGDDWIRDAKYGGPFVGMKTMIPKALFATQSASGENYITGLDVNIIRLADVVLMAAECEVELGNLSGALILVNSVRNRAAKLEAKKTIEGKNAARYSVKPYPVFTSQDNARQAVRFERRLELAMEGHRFFDLVRWGIAKDVITTYSAFEGVLLPSYKNLNFTSKSEIYPIPLGEIDKSNGTLTQNTGY